MGGAITRLGSNVENINPTIGPGAGGLDNGTTGQDLRVTVTGGGLNNITPKIPETK
jgi:hypothetical protein